MKLCADNKIKVQPGNFSSRIDGGVLVVPAVLAEMARAQHLLTAEEFAGYTRSFPSAVAALLGWKPTAVVTAADRLNEQLSDAGIVRIVAAPRRVYGLG